MSARAAVQAPAQHAQGTAVNAPKENIFMFVPNLIGTLLPARLRIQKLTRIQVMPVSSSQLAR
jgi:hypothetical protein